MIAAETIDRVREEADIVSVIGEHVKLKRSGGDYRGPVPRSTRQEPQLLRLAQAQRLPLLQVRRERRCIGFVREHLGSTSSRRSSTSPSARAWWSRRAARDGEERDARAAVGGERAPRSCGARHA
jgi:hypothetical protein